MADRMSEDILAKAKGAASPEELVAIAKENGIALTIESAEELFEKLHNSGELSDEELDDVSGGGCGEEWRVCPRCGEKMTPVRNGWICLNCRHC